MTDKNKISEEESKKKNMENNPEIYFQNTLKIFKKKQNFYHINIV